MSEEKSSSIGIIIVAVVIAVVAAYFVGKSGGDNGDQTAGNQQQPTNGLDTNKTAPPTEPKEPAFVKEGLVAHYPFNGNAKDESDTGNDGEIKGATLTVDRHGEEGKAYSFDGEDDYIEVKDTDSLRPAYITLSVWIKLGREAKRIALINKSESTRGILPRYEQIKMDPVQFHIKRESKGRPTLGWQSSGSASPPSIGVWEQRVGVWDGKEVKFYVNGMLAASKYGLEGPMDDIPGGNFHFGVGWDLNGAYFPGQMDDVRIYNRALSADEVKALYDFEKAKE